MSSWWFVLYISVIHYSVCGLVIQLIIALRLPLSLLLTLESRRSMLSRLLLLWMRPLMRRSDGLPWLVLDEDAAVTEPAVGLGCILRSAPREREEGGGQRKNNSATSGRVSTHPAWLYHSRTKCHGQDWRRGGRTQWSRFLLFKRPQSPAG